MCVYFSTYSRSGLSFIPLFTVFTEICRPSDHWCGEAPRPRAEIRTRDHHAPPLTFVYLRVYHLSTPLDHEMCHQFITTGGDQMIMIIYSIPWQLYGKKGGSIFRNEKYHFKFLSKIVLNCLNMNLILIENIKRI